tara:strand:- start:2350 stop:3426 length:1077 start_codon:yes stop_codon:yes gene_type:complete
MKRLFLKTNNKKTPIVIGKNIIKSSLLSKFIDSKDVVIITNTTVGKLHLKKITSSLKKFNINVLTLSDGEQYKNIQTLSKIHDYLIKMNFDRNLTIIALGGGVIGDLVGFASDTFLRGVNLIHIPTSLLAQVDSAIGGKTGINHKFGKNLIGTFKQPNAVIIDINYLLTLPDKEFNSGLAEVVKYGVISNSKFLKWLNNNSDLIIKKNSNALLKIVEISVKEKISVVAKDEKESNIRAFLNFGHTLGHAIEASMSYKNILHGHAVSIGMLFATMLSVDKSTLNIDEFNLIESTIRKLKLPISIPRKISTSKIMSHMSFDKKRKQGKNNFILLKSIGKCYITDKLTNSYITNMIKNFRS